MRHIDFIERLHIAAHWEAYVASAFTREGFHVLLGPTHVGKPEDFAQSIDLRIASEEPKIGPDGEYDWAHVEVKGTAPRVENGLVLICSEYSFDNKNGPEGTELYAHFVFCSPKSGKMFALLEGTPIIRGHTQTDSIRGQTYNVIKAESRYLIPFQDLCKALR